MLTAVALGFVLGLRHAFDPDHLIAVSAIAARHRSPWAASWVGASWGLGHAATILACGLAVVALRVSIPEDLSRGFELCVGLLLVWLGVANLAASRPRAAASAARAGAAAQQHIRTAVSRSGWMGLAHGLAGTAPVVLLATAAMPGPATAALYLGVFGLGSILGMVAFSLLLGAPFALLGDGPGARRLAAVATGLVSLAFGAWLVYAAGFGRAPALPV